MSKFEKLDVDIRKEQGTSAARRTRLRGRVPAVLYHSGVEATPLSMDRKALYKALKTGQMIFEVTVEEKPQFVLLKEVQYHPVTDEVIHIGLLPSIKYNFLHTKCNNAITNNNNNTLFNVFNLKRPFIYIYHINI